MLRERNLKTYHAEAIRKSLVVLKEMNRKQRVQNEAFLRRHDEEIRRCEQDKKLQFENLRSRKARYARVVSELIPTYYKQCEMSKIQQLRKTQERYEMIRKRRLLAKQVFEREQELSSALSRGRHELKMEEAREISETLERTARRDRFERNTENVTNAIDRAAMDTTRVLLHRVLEEEGEDDKEMKIAESLKRSVLLSRSSDRDDVEKNVSKPMASQIQEKTVQIKNKTIQQENQKRHRKNDETTTQPIPSTSPTYLERRGMKRIEEATRVRDDAVMLAHEKARMTGRLRASLDKEADSKGGKHEVLEHKNDTDENDDNLSRTSTTPPTTPPSSPSHFNQIDKAPSLNEVHTEESTTPPASPPEGDSFTTDDDEEPPPPQTTSLRTGRRRFDVDDDEDEFGEVENVKVFEASLGGTTTQEQQQKDGNLSSSSDGSFTW